MRNLEDHFCTYEQENQLIQIGYTEKFISLFEGLQQTENFTSGILRSQALDYFRELGYKIVINQNERGNWYEIEKDGITRTQGVWHAYEFSESEAISRLIKLEKEVRNE
jgi:hypothetical protein